MTGYRYRGVSFRVYWVPLVSCAFRSRIVADGRMKTNNTNASLHGQALIEIIKRHACAPRAPLRLVHRAWRFFSPFLWRLGLTTLAPSPASVSTKRARASGAPPPPHASAHLCKSRSCPTQAAPAPRSGSSQHQHRRQCPQQRPQQYPRPHLHLRLQPALHLRPPWPSPRSVLVSAVPA